MVRQQEPKDASPSHAASALAEQVVAALHALTRGLQAADTASGNTLLGATLAADPAQVHRALATTLLRMVFVLHAEDRSLMPPRVERAARSAGGWRQLVAVFRALHEAHGGQLFDPSAHPFLDATPIADDVLHEVLESLLVVRGERLSYRALDLEHLGSVYEAVMGFTIEIATEPSLALRARRKPGAAPADPFVGLRSLLATAPSARLDALAAVGVDLPGRMAAAVREATTELALVAALARRISPLSPVVVPPGRMLLQPTEERRRAGAHYTSPALAEATVARTLQPLLAALGDDPDPDSILALRVCDPAMGSGAFLLAACRILGDALVTAWTRRGGLAPVGRARRLVARRSLYGVDKDPFAVELARLSLWLFTRATDLPFTFVDHALRHGDALVGLTRVQIAAATDEEVHLSRATIDAALGQARDLRVRGAALGEVDEVESARLLGAAGSAVAPVRRAADRVIAGLFGGSAAVTPFHWAVELPEVFPAATGQDGASDGFDAFVGNPPWVSYAGRASQPLGAAHRAWFDAHHASFDGFKNLQGVFVEQCARLLRSGGRLGLVLPSSMSEQQGYAPSRRAHDRLAACDEELRDVGEDAFRGVFQPSMVLTSTRRPSPIDPPDAPWPVERPDLDDAARSSVARMIAGPVLPSSLFGERGLQSSGEDLAHLKRAPDRAHDVPLRAGGDIRAFFRGPSSYFADRRWFASRLRGDEVYREVRLLIRQTAPYPIATLSDGTAFRNSILAGFESAEHPADFLVAYLNATPIRWLHFVRHRDARQGMPQLKIGHLRATPAPPRPEVIVDLARLGADLAARNEGARPAEQAAIDELVADAFGLAPDERARIATWARLHLKEASA